MKRVLKYTIKVIDARKVVHKQYDIWYHNVWITKYGKKIIVGKIVFKLKVLLMKDVAQIM